MSEPRATRPGFQPGYGVHEDDAGMLEWSWAQDRLTTERQFWLATTRADGRPHLAPVWGVWVAGAFWFGTNPESVKGLNLERDGRCSVSTESGLETVILEGAARLREYEDLPEALSDTYFEKYAVRLPVGPVYAVEPSVGLGFRETAFPETATRWTFA